MEMAVPATSMAALKRTPTALDGWSGRELPGDHHGLANLLLAAAARHSAVVDQFEALLSVRLDRRLSAAEEATYRLLAEAERALLGAPPSRGPVPAPAVGGAAGPRRT